MQVVFPLTLTDVPARFAIRADGTLNPKDYVLKISFSGVDMTRELAKELKLHYSRALDAIYIYNRGQNAGQTGYTSYFSLPDGATNLTVEAMRWAKSGEALSARVVVNDVP